MSRLDAVHQVAARVIRASVWWTDIDWRRGTSQDTTGEFVNDGRGTVDDVEQAEAVSSQWRKYPHLHSPLIDLDVPAVVLPSSTSGHGHLYIEKAMPWEDLEKLLVVMVEVGLVEPGYLAASRKRKATFLRLPWIRKGHELDDRHDAGGWSVEEVEEFLEAPAIPVDPMLDRSGWTTDDVPF